MKLLVLLMNGVGSAIEAVVDAITAVALVTVNLIRDLIEGGD